MTVTTVSVTFSHEESNEIADYWFDELFELCQDYADANPGGLNQLIVYEATIDGVSILDDE